MVFKWYVLPLPNRLFKLTTQISCITDMVAVPTSMAENLSKAKGSYGHAAAQAVKGAAYSAVNVISNQGEKK